MASTEKIVQDINNAIKSLIDGDKRWEEILKGVENVVDTYNYLQNHLSATRRFDPDPEMTKKHPNLKDGLLSTILEKFHNEIITLEHIRDECKEILDGLETQLEDVLSGAPNLEAPENKLVASGIECLKEGVSCLTSSYSKIIAAILDAKTNESAIPKSSFLYDAEQRQTVERAVCKWDFYST